MHTTMDDDKLNMRNSAICHAVSLFENRPLGEIEYGFWNTVDNIYAFLRAGKPAGEHEPCPRCGSKDIL